MLFTNVKELTHGKTKDSGSTEFLTISRGVVHLVWITFPPGCAHLAKVQLYDGGHQFLPSTEGMWVHGDGITRKIPLFYEMSEEPLRITIRAWNEDDIYEHTITVEVSVLPKMLLLPQLFLLAVMERLEKLFV